MLCSSNGTVPHPVATALAYSFQTVATAHLCSSTKAAIEWCKTHAPAIAAGGVRQVVLCGGVASNTYIRSQIKKTVEAQGTRLLAVFCAAVWSFRNHFEYQIAVLKRALCLTVCCVVCYQV